MVSPALIAIMGPTASGKSLIAEALARQIGAQLLSADAFHVYRGFDVGTNKPKDQASYRLLNLKGPRESFGLGEWVRLAHEELKACFARGQSVVVVGGTGLYVRALFEEWIGLRAAPDPQVRAHVQTLQDQEGLQAVFRRLSDLDAATAQTIDQSNPVRVRRALERALDPGDPIENSLPPFQKTKLGLNVSIDDLNTAIDKRTVRLLESGWIEEVQELIRSGVQRGDPAMRAIGYRSVLDLIEKNIAFAEACQSIQLQTRQYAKRQRTWLRSEPNLEGIDFDGYPDSDASFVVRSIEGFLSQLSK